MNNSEDIQPQGFKWTLPFNARDFAKHITAEDQLQAIVRGHLYVEHILIEFLKLGLPAFDLLNVEKLTFVTKVDVCAALNLVSPHAVPAIKKLNSIRNKVAHNLNYRFDDAEKRAIVAALPNAWRNAILEKSDAATKSSVEKVTLYDILLAIITLLDAGLKRYLSWKEMRQECAELLARVVEVAAVEREEFAGAQFLVQRLSEGFVQGIEDK